MILSILNSKHRFFWMIFHLILGVVCTFSKWFLIVWFFLLVALSINKIISCFFNKKINDIFLPLVIYLSSLEVFGRMVKAYPMIPWELSKYLLLLSCLFLILIQRIRRPYLPAMVMTLLLIPGSLVDTSNRVGADELISNLLGPMSMCIFMICFASTNISSRMFNNILRLIWLTTIPVLFFSIVKTPDFGDITFELGALIETSGNFGSNQVASILGLGMFLSYYAWMNRLLFSANHTFDGIFIGLFAYQGLLTFSRGGIVISLISMLVYFILFRSSRHFTAYKIRNSLRPLLFFGFAILVFAGSYAVIENRSKGNLTLRYIGESVGTLSGNKNKTLNTFTSGRYEILKSDLKLWSNNIIFGAGAGASKYLRSGINYGISTHTELSRLLAEHGIFGLIFMLVLFKSSISSFKKNDMTIYRNILITLFLIGIGTSLHSGMRTFITPILMAIVHFNIYEEDGFAIDAIKKKF